jgi:hypothetical protein
MKRNSEKGFIAIISAIIISGILMLVVASSGLSGIYSRSNTLDTELKERADAAADACVDEALLQLAQNSSYTGGIMTTNSLDQCRIGKVTTSGSNYQFEVQATSSNMAVTNLLIWADTGDLTIKRWLEITVF